MILPDQNVQVPRQPEQEALDEIAVEEDGVRSTWSSSER